jgi:hypothetical protein
MAMSEQEGERKGDLIDQLVPLDGGEALKFLRDNRDTEVGLPSRQALHGGVPCMLTGLILHLQAAGTQNARQRKGNGNGGTWLETRN